jgi:hypothetical protein
LLRRRDGWKQAGLDDNGVRLVVTDEKCLQASKSDLTAARLHNGRDNSRMRQYATWFLGGSIEVCSETRIRGTVDYKRVLVAE